MERVRSLSLDYIISGAQVSKYQHSWNNCFLPYSLFRDLGLLNFIASSVRCWQSRTRRLVRFPVCPIFTSISGARLLEPDQSHQDVSPLLGVLMFLDVHPYRWSG